MILEGWRGCNFQLLNLVFGTYKKIISCIIQNDLGTIRFLCMHTCFYNHMQKVLGFGALEGRLRCEHHTSVNPLAKRIQESMSSKDLLH
jgi:hypothetical protein